MCNQQITNIEARHMLEGQSVIYVPNSYNIEYYTKRVNYYNADEYGWNYSIGYNSRHKKYVICGYQIPQSVLSAAKEVITMYHNDVVI